MYPLSDRFFFRLLSSLLLIGMVLTVVVLTLPPVDAQGITALPALDKHPQVDDWSWLRTSLKTGSLSLCAGGAPAAKTTGITTGTGCHATPFNRLDSRYAPVKQKLAQSGVLVDGAYRHFNVYLDTLNPQNLPLSGVKLLKVTISYSDGSSAVFLLGVPKGKPDGPGTRVVRTSADQLLTLRDGQDGASVTSMRFSFPRRASKVFVLKDDRLVNAFRLERKAAKKVDRKAFKQAAGLDGVKLLAGDGQTNDLFGASVALSGDGSTLVVGADSDDETESGQGSVYVYQSGGDGWTLLQKLVAQEARGDAGFGSAVAISGDTLVIGAPREKLRGNKQQGAVYIFVWRDGAWVLQEKVFNRQGSAYDHFGSAVAIDGDTVVIGSAHRNRFQGAAAIYGRENGTWSFVQELTATAGVDGVQSNLFGVAVAIHQDTVVIGARGGFLSQSEEGSVHVFRRSGDRWEFAQLLTASDGQGSAVFGTAVALSGDGAILLIGAAADNLYTDAAHIGAVYVFTRSDATADYSEQQKLTVDVAVDGEFIGDSLAVNASGSMLVTGAPRDAEGEDINRGSAHVFVRQGEVWTHLHHLVAPDGAQGDRFGASVAINEDTVAVGVPFDQVEANEAQGAVWLYALP